MSQSGEINGKICCPTPKEKNTMPTTYKQMRHPLHSVTIRSVNGGKLPKFTPATTRPVCSACGYLPEECCIAFLRHGIGTNIMTYDRGEVVERVG